MRCSWRAPPPRRARADLASAPARLQTALGLVVGQDFFDDLGDRAALEHPSVAALTGVGQPGLDDDALAVQAAVAAQQHGLRDVAVPGRKSWRLGWGGLRPVLLLARCGLTAQCFSLFQCVGLAQSGLCQFAKQACIKSVRFVNSDLMSASVDCR